MDDKGGILAAFIIFAAACFSADRHWSYSQRFLYARKVAE
ncbi:hypothetical protein GMES_3954 [Paraglaciecola mesophila KMM 241]|uniref:Lipoprotein n=1 Tax=Paraglaciecola mesophila KMM 241 TaxID=1128912 RepID=K6Z768_9ALTE|nr:hypothetical protein GMES_3954 [Paraglaciecola mesophila KMM 241]